MTSTSPAPEERAPGRASTDAGHPYASRWEYFGVGCFGTFAGFAGGGMIAVLVAKFVGLFTKCPAELETGAPCNWFMFAVAGALVGALAVPSVSVWFFRRGRIRALSDGAVGVGGTKAKVRNFERG